MDDAAKMHELLRSTVNTWECDEMGHLNVRHYPARESEATRVLLGRCGLSPAALREHGLRVRFIEKHIRFHRELRPGAAFTGFGGILDVQPDALTTYVELRSLTDGRVAATVVGRLGLCPVDSSQPVPLTRQWCDAAQTLRVALPDHGAPRGVGAAPPRPAPSLEEARTLGMVGEYLGVSDPVNVDAHGFVEPAGHIARISDGIQHFFNTLTGPRQDGIGGAVLEFRIVSHNEARAGDLIEVRSGLKGVGNRARHFCHWVFDATTGASLATSEVVAVAFDLKKRRAAEFPAEVRQHMLTKVIDGISI